MARLPTADELSRAGGMPAPYTAPADVTAAGQGLASFGGAVADIGADLRKQEDTVDIARAEAAKLKGFIDVDNEFSQDGDYSTFGRRAPVRNKSVIENAAKAIRNPEMRTRWLEQAKIDAIRANDQIDSRGRALGKQAETVAFDDALETNRRVYVDPETSEDAKKKARADIEGAITMGERSGLLTPEQAAARREQYIRNANYSRAQLAVEQNPDSFAPHSVVASGVPPEGAALLDTIAGTESPGYNVLNGGERFSSFEDHPRRVGKGGTATAAGRYQFVKKTWDRAQLATGVPDFSPASQDKAAWWLAQNDYKASTGRDLLTDLKSKDPNTIAGVRRALSSTWEGLKSLGDNTFNAKLEAGPVSNPNWFNELSPEEKQKVYQAQETAQRQRATAQQGNLEVVTQNAPVAVQNTGQYDGLIPTEAQFVSAYGAQDGAERYAKFAAAMDVSQQAYNFRTMSSQDIEQAVAAAQPTSSGNDAALETTRYDTLAKAGAQAINARNADPATYAQQAFPSVGRAWESAATTGDYQSAMTETATAQRQLGIANMQLLPKDIADNGVARFKDENLSQQDRINAVSGLVFATPDADQRRAVFEQLVAAGLPDTTEGALDAFARGDEGAARRLMQAAMVDPSKLPGKAPYTPDEIDTNIQAEIMDTGQIGDIFYGLTDGTVENQQRAIRDSKLLTNTVNLRVRNGETLEAAIEGAKKDLYGDVQPVTGDSRVDTQILLPADADPTAVLDGLAGLLPTVRSNLEKNVVVPPDAVAATGGKAVLDSGRQNYIDNVMAEGYFRNAQNGYVFIDPYVGAAVSDADGNPLTFTDDQVFLARPDQPSLPEPGGAFGIAPPSDREMEDIERFGKKRAETVTGGGGGY